jgi:hypothetical protein
MRSLNSNHSAQKYLKGDQDQQIESDYHNLHNNTQTAEYFILHGYFGPVIMALWLNGATGRGGGKSIIGGLIFIYSCSQTVKTIAFKGNK